MNNEPEADTSAKYKLIADMWTDVAHIHGCGIHWQGYARTLHEQGQSELATLAENFAKWLDLKELAAHIPPIE